MGKPTEVGTTFARLLFSNDPAAGLHVPRRIVPNRWFDLSQMSRHELKRAVALSRQARLNPFVPRHEQTMKSFLGRRGSRVCFFGERRIV